jgi:hypothetical protein
VAGPRAAALLLSSPRAAPLPLSNTPPTPPPKTKQVAKVVQGTKLLEGAGVQICRTVGTPALRSLDPFLMLDELKLPADQ